MSVKDGQVQMKNDRGQITIEAILIIGFFISFFLSISLPTAFNVRDSAIDTTILSEAKFATEQIASVINTVIINGSKETIDVYIPGYKSENIHIGTRICTNGGYITTTVLIARSELSETYSFSEKLYGSEWNLSTPDAQATDRILEDEGRRYTITVEYKNVTSNTNNTMTGVTKSDTVCTQSLETQPGGW